MEMNEIDATNIKKRIKQKKKFYNHTILYIITSIFILVIEKLLGYGKEYNWSVWIVVIWSFLFVLHFVNIFITKRFFGKEWEEREKQNLVEQQRKRAEHLKNDN